MTLLSDIHPLALEFHELGSAIKIQHGREPNKLSGKIETVKRSNLELLSIPRLKKQTRVLITGLPRSGTGFIQSIISSFPNAFCKGEVFSPNLHRYDNYSKMATILAERRHHELFGLKFLFFQSPHYFQDISRLSQSGWKVIGCQRNNFREQALSYYLATASGIFHRHQAKELSLNINVNLELLENSINLFSRCQSILETNYQDLGKDMLRIDFERDIVDSSGAIGKVSDYLGKETGKMTSLELSTFGEKRNCIENQKDVNAFLDSFSISK